MSLRSRLNLLVACLNAAFLLALAALLMDNHRQAIFEETEAAHRVAVQMLGTAVQASRLLGSSPAVMSDFLRGLGPVRSNVIRLYGAAPSPLHDSSLADSADIRHAPEWFARLMRPQLDATVIGMAGLRMEVIPDPAKAILDAWDSVRSVLVLGVGFAAFLHVALYFLLRRLLQPTEADARRLVSTTRELAEKRQLARLIEAGVEAERKRLARELHDELGQSVTAIRLIATSLTRGSEADASPAHHQGAAQINEIAAGIYDGMHRIIRELRPTALEQSDLAAALQDMAEQWRRRYPAPELKFSARGDLSELGEELNLAVFRTIQEALTNVVKHAGATRVEVKVERLADWIEVSVSDDGGGAQEDSGSGWGLVGMRERAAGFGGELSAGRQPAGGFRVSIRFPVSGENT